MVGYLCALIGFLLGLAIPLYQPTPPVKPTCDTFKVSTETAYVLQPPHQEPEIVHEKCPAPKVEEPKIEEPVVEEPPRRRHRRYHRRRHWR